VGLGAIVVTGDVHEGLTDALGNPALFSEPLAYLDVLGRSTAERIIERFVHADVDVVSVFQASGSSATRPSFTAFENVTYRVVRDTTAALQHTLQEYSRNGIEHAFLIMGSVYAETDLLDLFYFHREAKQVVTRAIDREGPLDLWVVDCAKVQEKDLKTLRAQNDPVGTPYFIREYVNRLNHPRDLRRFATDLLRGRCLMRPPGREVKRGIWIDEGADVHRRARIVAPAYVGRASKISEDTLITRFSTVEKNCCVDYGTVIEDSSILQNTEIGICLDVCHAVATGNKLLSLDRNVVIEISDPSVMRSNGSSRKHDQNRSWARNLLSYNRRKPSVTDVQPAASAPELRRLQTNFFQG
jgi:hypothetical protein